MRVIADAERFVHLMESCPRTPARQSEAETALKALLAAPWDAAEPEDREAGWTLILRRTLLTRGQSIPAAGLVA
jgi:hypothetical protein